MKFTRIVQLFLLLVVFFPTIVIGQQPIKDSTVYALRLKGVGFYQEGRLDSALFYFQEARDGYAELKDTNGQARCCMAIGNIYRMQGHHAVSENALRMAYNLTRGRATNKPADLNALISLHYATLCHQKKTLGRADTLYAEALQVAMAKSKPNDLLFAYIYNNWGGLYMDMERYDKAEPVLQQALKAYDSGGADMIDAHVVYINLGKLYQQTFDFDKAYFFQKKLADWVDTMRTIPYHVSADLIYHNLGVLLSEHNRYAEAVTYYQKAMSLVKDPALMALSLNNVGATFLKMKQYEQATTYLSRAMTVTDSVWKTPCDRRAQVWSDLAVAYTHQTKQAQADSCWAKAMEEADLLHSPSQRLLVNRIKAESLLNTGRHSAAIELYEKSIHLAEDSKQNGIALSNNYYIPMGSALLELGRYNEALNVFNKAIHLTTTANATLDTWGHPADGQLVLTAATSRTLIGKASALLKLWERDTQNISLLQRAWHAAQQALRVNESFRQRYCNTMDPIETNQYEGQDIYNVAMSVVWHLFERQPNNAYAEAAFQLADRRKSNSLIEKALSVEAKQFAGIDPALLEEEKRLSGQITYYERKAFEATAEGQTTLAATYRDSLLFRLKREQERLIANIEKNYPHYYEFRYRIPTVTPDAVCQFLKPRDLFVEYFLDKKQELLYIFTIDHQTGLQIKRVPFPKGDLDCIQELYTSLQSILLVRIAQKNSFGQTSAGLYQQLIAPIAEKLEGKEKLLLVVEEELFYVPFELLLSKTPNDNRQQPDFLIRHLEVSYQYATSTFIHQQRARLASKPSPTADLLVFAPVFGKELSMRWGQREASSSTKQSTVDVGSFTSLPFSELEAKSIVHLRDSAHTSLLLHEQATEKALKASLQTPHQWIHLSSHSFADLANPKYSGIACAPSSDEEDGILYANEIYTLQIPTDLVVLSSCESGMGQLQEGEGMLGINRAFAYAGVPNVVYSLWKVNDRASSNLMIEFYKNVFAGKTYSAALRAAKLKMLDNPSTASPNFWGGFLLMGQ